MRADTVEHSGKIVEITPQFTTVEIVSESACSACHAKGLCSLGESKTKAVQVPTSPWQNYQVGDTVILQLKASMGHKAVWIGYVIPLIILMAVLLGATATGVHELKAGLLSIAAVALYYLAVWLFQEKLKKEYIFSIKQ